MLTSSNTRSAETRPVPQYSSLPVRLALIRFSRPDRDLEFFQHPSIVETEDAFAQSRRVQPIDTKARLWVDIACHGGGKESMAFPYHAFLVRIFTSKHFEETMAGEPGLLEEFTNGSGLE